MKKWIFTLCALMAIPNSQASELEESPKTQKVVILPIRDNIMPPLVYLVRRGVKEAMVAEADLLVLDMETNGGRVDVTEEIMEILNRFEGQKVTYVNRKALSAGAFISVATQKIYMAPQSVIGAAAPVMMTPGGTGVQEMPNTMEVKMTSALSAMIRASAKKNGHNKDVIDAMVDKSAELVVDGEVLCEKGDILTLTNDEAEKEYGDPPRPLLSAGTMESIDDLLASLDLSEAERISIEPTGAERVGSWINKISPLLLIIGVIGIYIEFKTPGFGLPGIVGISAFVIYFLGGYIAGLSGFEWAALFFLGLILVIIELFVFPGTVILGMTGAGLMLVSVLMALVDLDPTMPVFSLPSSDQLSRPLEVLSISVLGTIIAILILSRYLPKAPLFDAMVSKGTSAAVVEKSAAVEKETRLGRTGETLSVLRPSGKAQFGDEVLDCIARGELIEKGQAVKIVGFSGREAVVESVDI